MCSFVKDYNNIQGYETSTVSVLKVHFVIIILYISVYNSAEKH